MTQTFWDSRDHVNLFTTHPLWQGWAHLLSLFMKGAQGSDCGGAWEAPWVLLQGQTREYAGVQGAAT